MLASLCEKKNIIGDHKRVEEIFFILRRCSADFDAEQPQSEI